MRGRLQLSLGVRRHQLQMMRPAPLLLAGLCFLAACRDGPRSREAPSHSGATAARAALATPHASAAAWADSSCGVDTVRSSVPASVLIHEYVARNDSLGYFAGDSKTNDAWVLRAAECPGHLGGSDIGEVTRSFAIDSLGATADSAHYRVRYEVVGTLEPTDTTGLHFVPGAKVDSEVVLVVRTPYGWRLSGQVGDLRINARHAAPVLHLPAAQAALIDSTIHVRDSGSRPDA